jgi:hypothetical protein
MGYSVRCLQAHLRERKSVEDSGRYAPAPTGRRSLSKGRRRVRVIQSK